MRTEKSNSQNSELEFHDLWLMNYRHSYITICTDTLASDGLVPVPDQELPGGLQAGLLNVEGPSHFEQPNDAGVGTLIKARVKPNYSQEIDVFELQNCTF